MKFTTAYYLMILYLTVIFKPLIPVVSDVWSHLFDEEIHVATVNAKYGKNHLEQALANKASENNNPSKSTLNSEEQVPVHLFTGECNYDFRVAALNKPYLSLQRQQLLTVCILHLSPPPEFS